MIIPQNNPLMVAALGYATRYKWRVFPLHSITPDGTCSCRKADCTSPGKHPRTSHGFLAATADEAQIKAWWNRWPNANVGVATGQVSAIVVLDIDPKHDGPDSWARLIEQHPLVTTLSSITGSGGTHYLFQAPDISLRSTEGVVAPGVDTRAAGGYIVAPPSNHLSGNCYRWGSQVPPSPVPDWLISLWPKQNTATTQQRAPAILGPVQDGYRNKTLTSWAGSMRARGMSEAAVLAALRVENETRCIPPLPDGVVQAIAQGMNRYDLGAPAPYIKPKNHTKGRHRKIYLPTVEVPL